MFWRCGCWVNFYQSKLVFSGLIPVIFLPLRTGTVGQNAVPKVIYSMLSNMVPCVCGGYINSITSGHYQIGFVAGMYTSNSRCSCTYIAKEWLICSMVRAGDISGSCIYRVTNTCRYSIFNLHNVKLCMATIMQDFWKQSLGGRSTFVKLLLKILQLSKVHTIPDYFSV